MRIRFSMWVLYFLGDHSNIDICDLCLGLHRIFIACNAYLRPRHHARRLFREQTQLQYNRKGAEGQKTHLRFLPRKSVAIFCRQFFQKKHRESRFGRGLCNNHSFTQGSLRIGYRKTKALHDISTRAKKYISAPQILLFQLSQRCAVIAQNKREALSRLLIIIPRSGILSTHKPHLQCHMDSTKKLVAKIRSELFFCRKVHVADIDLLDRKV